MQRTRLRRGLAVVVGRHRRAADAIVGLKRWAFRRCKMRRKYKLSFSGSINFGIFSVGFGVDPGGNFDEYYYLMSEIKELRSMVSRLQTQVGVFESHLDSLLQLTKNAPSMGRYLIQQIDNLSSQLDFSTSILALSLPPTSTYTLPQISLDVWRLEPETQFLKIRLDDIDWGAIGSRIRLDDASLICEVPGCKNLAASGHNVCWYHLILG